MKVLLIASNIAETPYAVYPLGMSMVAGALQAAGHTVVQCDFLSLGKSTDAIVSAVNEEKPDVIGISIRNIDNVNCMNERRYIDVVKAMVTAIKEHTDIPIVLGGTGFSILPEIILDEVGGDYGIVGEGEVLMVQFVNDLAQGIRPNKKCLRSENPLGAHDIPLTAYDPTLLQFYLQRGNVASVQTKRGCTHRCVYCSYPLLEGNHVRSRDPQSVVDDIQNLMDTHGAKYIFFTDSVFNDDGDTYLDIVHEMKKRNIVVSWTAFFKPEGLTEEKILSMKETGLCAAEMGADASTDTTLRKMGKSFTFADVIATNELFVKNGIATAHYYMFGGPGETQETVKQGIANLVGMKNTASFIFMGIRILPNTILEKIAKAEGVISEDQNFLEPVYYIAPGLDKQWLEKTLEKGFTGVRYCVFPPDALDSSLQFMHKMGYSGSMWDMLLPKNRGRKKSTKDKDVQES